MEKNDNSSTSTSEVIEMFDTLMLSNKVSTKTKNDEGDKSDQTDQQTSCEENYLLETQESEEVNYNMELETEYSDFESLNDSENNNIIILEEIKIEGYDSNSSVEIELSDDNVVEPVISDKSNSKSSEKEISEIEENLRLELDSLLVKLNSDSFDRIQKLGFEFQSNLKIFNKKNYINSDSFKKLKVFPTVIGYIYLLNYKTKILISSKEDIHILYEKVVQEVISAIKSKIMQTNNDEEIVENYLHILSRLPPQINPQGSGISITGSETIILFLSALVSLVPTIFYIRGSKTPLTQYCISFKKFNEFIFALIKGNDKSKKNNKENYLFYKLQNRVDWSFNFFDITYDYFIEDDNNFLINFIETYFWDSNNIKLKVKRKIKYKYHYFIKNSICFTGDIYHNSSKIGQIISYYHNSIFFRNENIGSGRCSPLGLNINQTNILDKNSDMASMLASYLFSNNILKHGITRRIEIRAFKFNCLTIEFPILLKKACKILIEKFKNRKVCDELTFKSDKTSEKIVHPNSVLSVYIPRDTNINFNLNLFSNNIFHLNFEKKIDSLLKLYEKSITKDYMDVCLQVVIEEVLFIAFNGLRSTGLQYSFEITLLEKLIIKL